MLTTLRQHGLDFMILLATFFAPLSPMLLGIGAICLMDAITGVIAANKRGEEIRSNKMLRTIVKMLVYSILVISSFIMEKLDLIHFIPVVKVATSMIAVIELKSLYENGSDILGLDLWKFVKQVMDKKSINPNDIP